MKFNFRKIASTASSLLMAGSTVALAAAANYPAPFVSGSSSDVGVVYGSHSAASVDLAAVVDITNDLSTSLASSEGSGSTSVVSGEAYALFGSGDSKIYHNDSLNQQRKTVTDTDLPTVLQDTDLSGNVDVDLTHILRIGSNPQLTYAQQPTSDDDPQWGFALSTTATNAIYNASVTFDKAVNFTHADTEGESFTMFGNEFTVGSATDTSDLILFRASETLFLDSGSNPSAQVTIDGEKYTVELVAASDTAATVKLTDSLGNSDQKEINEAASKKIIGVEISVNTADESDALGTVSAEVIVGANKLKMTDSSEVLFGTDEDSIDGTKVTFTGGIDATTQIDIEVAAQDSDEDALLPGDEFADPVFASFKLVFNGITNDNDRETISVDNSGDDKMNVKFAYHGGDEKSINWVYNVTSDQKNSLYIPTTGALLADSGGDIFILNEMGQVNKSQYTIVGNEDEGFLLEVTTLTNSSSGFSSDKVTFRDVFSGQLHDTSITSEGSGTVSIGGNSYTITYFGASTASTESRFVRVNDPDSTGNDVNLFNTIETAKGAKVMFHQPTRIVVNNWDGSGANLANVSNFRIPDGDGYTSVAVDSSTGNFGNYSFGGSIVNTTSAAGSASAVVTVDSSNNLKLNFSSTGTSGTVDIRMVDPEDGGTYYLPGITVFEEEDDNNVYELFTVALEGGSTSTDGLGVSDVDRSNIGSVSSFITHDSNTDISSAATLWGTVLTKDSGESDQATLEISYPHEQLFAEIFIAANDASISGGSSTGGGALGSVHVMDTELNQVSSKNLIVVGGSCVNSVAATLLGSDAPLCGGAWESATGAGSGQFLIQTFDSPFASGKVATLVAGYNAADTRNAAKFLTTQTVNTDAGMKYRGTSATSAELVTG